MKIPESPQPSQPVQPVELEPVVSRHPLRENANGPARYGYGHNFHEPHQTDHSGSFGLLDYWRILRRHKPTWALIAFVGGLIGIVITLPQTPVYQAHLSLEIVGLNQNFMNMKEASPTSDSSSASDITDIQTQIKLLQSTSLMDRVIAKLDSSSSVTPQKSRFESLSKILNLPASSKPESSRHAALVAAADSLKVRVAPQTRVLEVTVDSTDSQIASQFANTLASEFTDRTLEARWQSTQKTSDWLSHQLDDMRIKLERSDSALQDYAHSAGILFPGPKARRTSRKKSFHNCSSNSPQLRPTALPNNRAMNSLRLLRPTLCQMF